MAKFAVGILAVVLLQVCSVAQTTPQSEASITPNSAPQPTRLEPVAATPLRVAIGKSLLVTTTGRLSRVSIADPNVADAVVVSPSQVLISGRSAGDTTLILWDEQKTWRIFDLVVEMDIDAAQRTIKATFPDEQINVTPASGAIILSGYVSTRTVAQHAGMVASAYSSKVINALNYAVPW